MVKLHGKVGKAPPAIGTRDIAQLLQRRCLLATEATFGPRRSAFFDSYTSTLECASLCTCPMAIRANNIAVRDFRHEPFARNRTSTLKNPKLLARITLVIEIHHIRREVAAAVSTWHAAQPAEELDRFSLTRADTLKFLLTGAA
jgi:hypothetical protein